MKKLTTNIFVEKSKIIHDEQYDYSYVNYVNASTKICIFCIKHQKEFYQTPSDHLRGNGCPLCRYEKSAKSKKYTSQKFIQKSIEVHGNKYDYSLVNYTRNDIPIIIICHKHGLFTQKPTYHLSGRGCYKCGKESMANKQRTKLDEFIEEAKNVHGDSYDYSKVVYKNRNEKICITCHYHGDFYQIPYSHINAKHGCPKCKSSHGEREIIKWLINNEIHYEHNKLFNDCISKSGKRMPFDFFIEKLNLCIEFDGKQHYTGWNNDKNDLENIKIRDEMKTNYCKLKNIRLLRIPYTDIDKINEILDHKVK